MKVETFVFNDLKNQVIQNFKELSKSKLFYIAIDRNEVWEQYLSGFSEDKKQEHNCNSCKSFLRQYAGIVTIKENKIISLWDGLEVSNEYKDAVENLKNYIHSLPVTDLFLSELKSGGTEKNLDRASGVIWNHFFLQFPKEVVLNSKDISPKLSQARDDKNVLKRSLDELTIEASETIMELIAQNSLYRGKESEPAVKAFLLLQRKYKKLAENEKNNFCWTSSLEVGPAISRIKNTAIGTLLTDLSEGMEIDAAVTRFEKVVAPTNYKRPTSLVTPKMVEQAKEKLTELGLLESLERRYANESDIRACDILFMDRSLTSGDVFDMVAKETIVNPRTFNKVEEVSIEDFLSKIVPTSKSISVLLENSQLNNFVSILTSQNPEAPSLFKWDNNFSWNYSGAIADSIKERVKQAGGQVEGELRASLSWFNYDDLDLHVVEPSGFRIYFRQKKNMETGGNLDVDMNAGAGHTRSPVENIIWPNKTKMREGTYKVEVNNFTKRETSNTGFVVQIECAGEVFDFEFKTNPASNATQLVAEFTYSKTDGIKFKGETKSNVVSKEKWGIKTNQFHKVTKLMLSPNHWDKAVGNKHYFFMLEGCKSDETPRPFFNEFLKQELDEHRKVFEILGSKVKIEDTDNQLSGIGFSDTKKASMIVKVTGQFTRTLKVTF